MARFADPLLLRPAVAFAEIERELAALGYGRDATSARTRELVPGEPELAGFRHASGTALVYTYNPALGLRVLEPREIARAEWLRLERSLPVLERAERRSLLASSQPSELVLGILASERLQDPEPREAIGRLRQHADPIVARAADKAFVALAPAAEAREKALALAAVLCAQLRPLLESLPALSAAELARQLEAKPADYAAVFEEASVEAARAAYARFWAEQPRIEPDPGAEVLRVYAAAAGMLLGDNELSFHFPGGYRQVAHRLRPERIWFAWRYEKPGERGGLALDGLVVLGDHAAWFPKPYRFLAEPS
jgi:hypothetical protein